jgi:hypothetical protein
LLEYCAYFRCLQDHIVVVVAGKTHTKKKKKIGKMKTFNNDNFTRHPELYRDAGAQRRLWTSLVPAISHVWNQHVQETIMMSVPDKVSAEDDSGVGRAAATVAAARDCDFGSPSSSTATAAAAAVPSPSAPVQRDLDDVRAHLQRLSRGLTSINVHGDAFLSTVYYGASAFALATADGPEYLKCAVALRDLLLNHHAVGAKCGAVVPKSTPPRANDHAVNDNDGTGTDVNGARGGGDDDVGDVDDDGETPPPSWLPHFPTVRDAARHALAELELFFASVHADLAEASVIIRAITALGPCPCSPRRDGVAAASLSSDSNRASTPGTTAGPSLCGTCRARALAAAARTHNHYRFARLATLSSPGGRTRNHDPAAVDRVPDNWSDDDSNTECGVGGLPNPIPAAALARAVAVAGLGAAAHARRALECAAAGFLEVELPMLQQWLPPEQARSTAAWVEQALGAEPCLKENGHIDSRAARAALAKSR